MICYQYTKERMQFSLSSVLVGDVWSFRVTFDPRKWARWPTFLCSSMNGTLCRRYVYLWNNTCAFFMMIIKEFFFVLIKEIYYWFNMNFLFYWNFLQFLFGYSVPRSLVESRELELVISQKKIEFNWTTIAYVRRN